MHDVKEAIVGHLQSHGAAIVFSGLRLLGQRPTFSRLKRISSLSDV
jgi:hypothetical protein